MSKCPVIRLIVLFLKRNSSKRFLLLYWMLMSALFTLNYLSPYFFQREFECVQACKMSNAKSYKSSHMIVAPLIVRSELVMETNGCVTECMRKILSTILWEQKYPFSINFNLFWRNCL